jgi:DNA-directed RNA polymerase specialized sigma24 family protein
MADMNERQQQLLNLLRNDVLRHIALWRMEGYSVDEIAVKLGVAERTVRRKLNLIRGKWLKELER